MIGLEKSPELLIPATLSALRPLHYEELQTIFPGMYRWMWRDVCRTAIPLSTVPLTVYNSCRELPKSTLGLAYADVRQWQAEQWTDFPELARALIAHGSSDLIAASVANDVADSLDPGAGTIGQLRSLLERSITPV